MSNTVTNKNRTQTPLDDVFYFSEHPATLGEIGIVIGLISDGVFVVQLLTEDTFTPSWSRLATIDEMKKWRFFSELDELKTCIKEFSNLKPTQRSTLQPYSG